MFEGAGKVLQLNMESSMSFSSESMFASLTSFALLLVCCGSNHPVINTEMFDSWAVKETFVTLL